MESAGVDVEEIDRTEDLYRARDRERLKAQIATGDLRAKVDRMITEPETTEEVVSEEDAKPATP
jgi:CPA2 family monovalent cation:H+ antiporter-2/glutathione-regulated potassium-efflux system protein KefB